MLVAKQQSAYRSATSWPDLVMRLFHFSKTFLPFWCLCLFTHHSLHSMRHPILHNLHKRSIPPSLSKCSANYAAPHFRTIHAWLEWKTDCEPLAPEWPLKAENYPTQGSVTPAFSTGNSNHSVWDLFCWQNITILTTQRKRIKKNKNHSVPVEGLTNASWCWLGAMKELGKRSVYFSVWTECFPVPSEQNVEKLP